MTKAEMKYCYRAVKTSSTTVGYIDKLQVRFALVYIVSGSKFATITHSDNEL